MGYSKLSDIIYTLNLEECNQIVQEAYRKVYNGDWDQNAQFQFHNGKIELYAPAYTPYMLFGRSAGKMPPQQPIESWMAHNGIVGDSWAIRMKIAKEGTKGNDFLTPAIEQVVKSLTSDIAEKLTSAMVDLMSKND